MQKGKKLIGMILCGLMLTGCHTRQLEDREFSQAMELEWNGEEFVGGFGRFLVEGDNVKEIKREYQDELDKYLDLGHVKVLILGENLMGNERQLKKVLREMEEMPVFARNILVLSHKYAGEKSYLRQLEEKGIVPGEYISNLYKNNPDKKSTTTLGELISRIFS